MDTKSGNKTGSKPNLNESTLPLLEEHEGKGETPEKEEKIEMETKGGEKGDEDQKEKSDADKKKDEKEKKKKEKKEKKPKEPSDKPKRSPVTCAQNFTIGLNVLDRDEKRINDQVNVVFEDLLGEPDSSHGFEFIWRLTFLLFNSTRVWIYRVIAAIIAIPLALLWAIIFAVINVKVVWCLTPSLRVFDLVLFYIHKVWSGLVRTALDPLFNSAALLFSNIRAKHENPNNIVSA